MAASYIEAETNPVRAAVMARQGKAIAAARRAAGVSRSAAAALLGVSRSTVCSWEVGRRACPLAHRRRMVGAWGADPHALETTEDVCAQCGRPFEVEGHSTRPR